MFWDMPLGKSIHRIASSEPWKSITTGIKEKLETHHYPFYYDELVKHFMPINIHVWVSHYIHIMDSQTAILEMIRSTGLKPYLESLESEQERQDFENQVLQSIKEDYPLQEDGKALFPFQRLFFMAKK